jgi:ABC-2 type transport system permease protein
MKRYLRLYGAFLVQWLKVLLDDRVNLAVGILSMVSVQAAGLIGVWAVLRHTTELNGWTFDELILLYGLLTLSRAISQFFGAGLWAFGSEYVRSGEFDRFLVRPVDPLFHLLANRIDHEAVGNFLVGLVLVIKAAAALPIAWTVDKLIFLLLAVPGGGLVLLSITLITAVSAFWLRDAMPVMWSVRHTEEFARLPLGIFKQSVAALLTWVVPVGFAAYYPASYLLDRGSALLPWLGPVVALVLFWLGYRFFQVGLRRYGSTGS